MKFDEIRMVRGIISFPLKHPGSVHKGTVYFRSVALGGPE